MTYKVPPTGQVLRSPRGPKVRAMRRIGGLAVALAVGDALQRSIESQQARVALERGRERHCVWESQGAVAPP